jgi:hypothetical protein
MTTALLTGDDTEHRALAAAAATWHLAGSLATLRDAINHHWPKRDHASDGTIGDARHAAAGSASDHNPWLNHTVRALDVDVDGINAPWLAEQLRLAGMHGDPRLAGGGYVIFDGRETSPDFTHWVPYDGTDDHTSHVHVSASRNPVGYEYTGPWQFLALAPAKPQRPQPVPAPHAEPAPQPSPPGPHDASPAAGGDASPRGGHDASGHGAAFRADYGDVGPHIGALQEFLRGTFPLYAGALVVDDVYGPRTAAVVAEFAHRLADDPHTPASDREGLELADGRNVGPRVARGFARFGFMG